jgi:hypothetical protein
MLVVQRCNILHDYRDDNANRNNDTGERFVTEWRGQDHPDTGHNDEKTDKKTYDSDDNMHSSAPVSLA